MQVIPKPSAYAGWKNCAHTSSALIDTIVSATSTIIAKRVSRHRSISRGNSKEIRISYTSVHMTGFKVMVDFVPSMRKCPTRAKEFGHNDGHIGLDHSLEPFATHTRLVTPKSSIATT